MIEIGEKGKAKLIVCLRKFHQQYNIFIELDKFGKINTWTVYYIPKKAIFVFCLGRL